VMRVEGEAPLGVEFSEKVRSTEGWHLERIGPPTTIALPEGKGARWEQTFKATPLQPGPQPLPLPAVQFTEKKGTPRDVAWTPLALTIKTRVAKVDISEAHDLAPIEELPPPASPPGAWWPWLLTGLPAIAIAMWLGLRRRARPMAEPTPKDVAFLQLAELSALAMATPADVERLHTRLSQLLRRYQEKRFDLPALRQTTPEFFAALSKENPLAQPHRVSLSDLLERCDLAKFAGVTPPTSECQRVLTLARDFVEQTSLTK
jgi:hypothetical protein